MLDGKCTDIAHKRADEPPFERLVVGEVLHLASKRNADPNRVDVRLMIAGDQQAAGVGFWNVFDTFEPYEPQSFTDRPSNAGQEPIDEIWRIFGFARHKKTEACASVIS